MARIDISGVGIEYELLGKHGAHAVAVTPGGRFGMDAPGVRELGEALARLGKRVLLWDRPNCGASDLCFEGRSESELQARILTQLIRKLDLGPTGLAGGSAGARTSLIAAALDPGVVSHLIQWWISGGIISLLALGAAYCSEGAVAASMGGMAAAAETPIWAGKLRSQPRIRKIFLQQDPARFIATMERWASAFVPSETSPVPGMATEDFARLSMPVLIYRSSSRDLYHPPYVCERVHRLIPHSELVDPPWPADQYLSRMVEGARTGTGHLLDWPLLAPSIAEFISCH